MINTDLLWKAYTANRAYDLVLNGGDIEFNGELIHCGGLSYYNDRIKNHLSCLIKQHKILDLGCGTGNFAIQLLKLNKLVFAVDSNPYMLKDLLDHPISGNFFISRQDINNLDLPIIFDGIISNNVLYLASIDPDKFFINVHKYLVSSGLFVLSSFLKDPKLDILIEKGENELKTRHINIKGKKYTEYDILKQQIDTVINVNKMLFESKLIKNTYSLEEICRLVENYGFSILDSYTDYVGQGFTLLARCI